MKYSIFGDGGWATTLSIILSEKYKDILLWSPDKKYAQHLKKHRKNIRYFPQASIPRNVTITSDREEALNFSQHMIVAIPSQYIRESFRDLKLKPGNAINILSCSKGIELKRFLRPTQILKEVFPGTQISCLSGPTIAREVYKKVPSCCVVASHHKKNALFWQHTLNRNYFRIYTSADVAGVELGGALKNIIAISCGMADGLGFGTNTKAALLCRGLVEMIRFAGFFGIQPKTLFGLTGLGDLSTTCFNPYSRNRLVGEKIAQGQSIQKIKRTMKMVAEGIDTTKSVYNLSNKLKLDMPITKEVYMVLYKRKDPRLAVKDLMSRSLKSE